MAFLVGCLVRLPNPKLYASCLLLRKANPVNINRSLCSNFRVANELGPLPRQTYNIIRGFQRSIPGVHPQGQLRRAFAYQAPPRVDVSKLPKNVLIFSYSNDRFFKLCTLFGILQLLFWFNIASFAFYVGDIRAQGKTLGDTNSVVNKIHQILGDYKYVTTGLCTICGYLVAALMWFYPRQSIHKLYLLRGGRNVRMITYNTYGSKRTLEFPVKDINCATVRTDAKSSIPIKTRGAWFHYTMDNKQGRWHNTQLFDHVIGLQRNIDNKKSK